MKRIGYSILLLTLIIGCASVGDVKKDSAQLTLGLPSNLLVGFTSNFG